MTAVSYWEIVFPVGNRRAATPLSKPWQLHAPATRGDNNSALKRGIRGQKYAFLQALLREPGFCLMFQGDNCKLANNRIVG